MNKSEKSEIEKLGEKLQKKIWRENKANLTKDGRRTMSVVEMGRLLGLQRTESYYLANKHYFRLIQIRGHTRVDIESFEKWYDNQVRYQKVDGSPPGRELKRNSYSPHDIEEMLGICEQNVYELIRHENLPVITVDYRMRIPKEAFDYWYSHQNHYRNQADRARDAVCSGLYDTIQYPFSSLATEKETDLALLVLTGAPTPEELDWLKAIQEKKVPLLVLLNKADLLEDPQTEAEHLSQKLDLPVMAVSAQTGQNIPELLRAIGQLVPEDFFDRTLLGDLVGPGDLVLLVMPQDTEAPKGRLILPQVQTTRELLDKKCTVVSTTTDCLETALAALAHPPKLIITDANSFPQVWAQKPPESILTAFTILFAGYKGDIRTFLEGASAIEALTENSRVLIAEACSHTHNEEDIGRKRVPALLRKKAGEGLTIDHVQGNDFPQDLSPYDLVIHCGACMFNRRLVMGRIAQAESQKIPITNYGIVLAAVSGILDQVTIPEG